MQHNHPYIINRPVTREKIEIAIQAVRSNIAHPDHVRDLHGNSLLYHLVLRNDKGEHNATIQELVETHKANINIENRRGITPLQLALNDPESKSANLMFLVRLGANPNVKNNQGNALLHVYTKNSIYYLKNILTARYQKEIYELVSKYGANINLTNKQGLTPLQCEMSKTITMSGNLMQLVRLGADPNVKIRGNNLLYLFVTQNKNGVNNKIIDELINEHNADCETINKIAEKKINSINSSRDTKHSVQPAGMNYSIQLFSKKTYFESDIERDPEHGLPYHPQAPYVSPRK